MNLKELDHKVKTDKVYAQILVEIANDSKVIEEAKRIIESLKVHIIETNYLSSNWVLLKLDVRDMTSLALKLTESGFNIKGINASQ
jgi:hypothetical protein